MTLLQQVPAWFKSTEVGQQMLTEAAEKTQAERQALAAEIESITEQLKSDLPGLLKTEKLAKAAVERARKALEAACEKRDAASKARSNAIVRADCRRDQLRARLRDSADPAIDEFIRKLRDAWDATRRRSPLVEEKGAGKFRRDGREVMTVSSTQPSLCDRMRAIQAAIREAEGLKLQAVGDVGEALAEIEKSIPDGEQLVKVA